ncbi:MAG TPA: ATP-binding protein [Chitinophagaceae bacterium]|nr:ATP-binding protein [Chitinophagaceae bacterium]
MIGLQSVILSTAFISYGAIQSLGAEPLSNENASILQRFAKVFEQTYTRFLDLQKAEAQTREAKIEAALERVRSRTMAMQRSEELLDVASILFQQVKGLGVPQWNCGFNIWNIGDREFTYYPGSPDGVISPTPCQIPLTEHPVFMRFDESRKRGDDLLIFEKQGEEQEDHYRYMLSLPGVGDLLRSMMDAGFQLPTFQIDHVANFSYGNLIFITFEHFPQMHDVFKRFAKVFDQTYTRFLDLQKAEAQAREAVKQASVDRIRAEIASMRTTNDLERIQPLIWNELTTLGVPFTRCGVFIMDEEHERVDTFLSTPDGRSIASFTSNYSDVAVISEALPYWRRKEIYKAHWDEATFLAQAKTLLEQGNITSTETYLTEHRPKDLYLHFLPFLQGILYVGNETPLNDEELQLVQNLADAFSIAYARYEDFNKLELAKEQIEKTLVDLKQTQAQLVQSEKMASLGELTAGIAHEIQNPLNFVNNFSEVNKELLAEMNEEIEKGNYEEVKNIANDVTDNEEKISHHGKRADAIVKGMLQHSRSSSGIKEPADINALADEYLRLAYHGLRAKDKFFNATMKTAYDETIGKINIVPQDIGRSVLNLITNAFYAVAEKKKQNGEGYEPTVTVTTKRINGRIEIRVADNGNGIPQKVVDKIFQPFFTTKPTGQGTGLGLSLSYDIIKAHGGEINVETKEGEGSDFFIFLPANN